MKNKLRKETILVAGGGMEIILGIILFFYGITFFVNSQMNISDLKYAVIGLIIFVVGLFFVWKGSNNK